VSEEPREEGTEEGHDGGEDEVGVVEELRRALQAERESRQALDVELAEVNRRLKQEKARTRELWRMNCAQLSEFDSSLSEKEEEIVRLREQLARTRTTATPRESPPRPLVSSGTPSPDRSTGSEEEGVGTFSRPRQRRGKAPPVTVFSGEDPDVRFSDWLSSLDRAAEWNGWEANECLLQLAGHLRGKALHEWMVLDEKDKATYGKAVTSLRERLDPGNYVLAAQDFRHLVQNDGEKVADFIQRLEKTFRLAYGRDAMQPETRDALLFTQLQEGLQLTLMESPSVSGATSYQSLCSRQK